MTRIVVTGAAGFIGSNIIAGLNARGMTDIIAVDDLKQGDKFRNLVDLKIADYVDMDTFYDEFAGWPLRPGRSRVPRRRLQRHHGAGRQVHDGQQLHAVVAPVQACQKRGARLLYASSAATYGGSDTFREDPAFEGAAQCVRLLQAAV